jgi:hypothetical protein
VVYPEDDPRLETELKRLREALPSDVPLLVGGRALAAYQEVVQNSGALPVESLAHLGSTLDGLRKPEKSKK